MRTTRPEKMYLDFCNNFLTLQSFSEHYGLTTAKAEKLINQGRKINQSKK